MKKLLTVLLCAPLILAGGGCDDYDDGPLKNRVDDLEQRIETLEELCRQANTNIGSLQTLVQSLQEKDYIESIAPIEKDGETIGYTITFTRSGTVTIYHGQNGATPVIGVRALEGVYYWTLDGEWLTDADGNRIAAQGAAGATPQMKIENGHWWVSTDGTEWTDLGPATGEDGDSFFLDVTQTDTSVVFTLNDGKGTVIKIPKLQPLRIVLEAESCALVADTPVEVAYTLTEAAAGTKVEAMSSGPVKAKATATTATEGVITLSTGDPEAIDEYTRVLVIASDGIRTAMAAITFEQGVLQVAEAFEAPSAGGDVEVPVETNLTYEVAVETAAQSWLTHTETRALRTDNLVFRAAANDGADRTGIITLTAGSLVRRICIAQKGDQTTYEIAVPTDFASGHVQKVMAGERQIAEICREYIRTGQTDEAMTVVYPMKAGKADLTRGFSTATGGTIVWDAATNSCTYTPGSATAGITTLYLEPGGTLAATTDDPAPAATAVRPDLLTDVRGLTQETYKIVKIGTQYWMAENLRAERYADGTAIPVGKWTSSVTSGACVYLFDSPADYKATLGALYNGYTLQNEGGLAPAGWDIPDNDAWIGLYTYLGGKKGNAAKLKSATDWPGSGTDVTGFHALPGQSFGGNDFVDTAVDTWFWSKTIVKDMFGTAAYYVRITDTSANIVHTVDSSFGTTHTFAFGHSVRCIRK